MPKTVHLSNPHGVNVNNGYAYWTVSSLQVADVSTIKNVVATMQISGNANACYGAGWNSTNVFVFFKPGESATQANLTVDFTVFFT